MNLNFPNLSQRLRTVTYDNQALTAAELSIVLDVDGHRADITMIKTAMTPFESGVLDERAIEQILEKG